MKVFTKEITVDSSAIDELNHVNNVVYLQWVQDIAAEHWRILTPPTMRSLYAWVVLRHTIDYMGAAWLHDILVVKTWVEKSAGARSVRHVEFYNKQSDKLLVCAITEWCLLDAVTMKPRKIETDILDLFH